MLHLSYYVVLGCVACVQVGSWAYFRRYQISSPPIGVFNVQDLAVMVLLIILVPLFYLILPLWLTAALLLLAATSILYFTWEPLLRARWAIWLATVTLLVVDSGAAFLGTKQNAFFAVNNIVLLAMGMGITNLWAQSGMKARDTALLGILLALYDFIATVQLPLMGELVARLSDLPLAPLVAWSSENTMPSIALGNREQRDAFLLPCSRFSSNCISLCPRSIGRHDSTGGCFGSHIIAPSMSYARGTAGTRCVSRRWSGKILKRSSRQ